MGMRTSDEPSFAGGQPASACSAPTNIPSQEEDEYRRAQLRREAPRRRIAPAPVKVCFAGGGARWGSVPPTSPRSPEDSLHPHAQLRQTFSHRRKTNTEERNSVEKPPRRRRAPAPVKLCFAGAGARWGCVPTTSPRSSEDSLRPHAQLRQTFGLSTLFRTKIIRCQK